MFNQRKLYCPAEGFALLVHPNRFSQPTDLVQGSVEQGIRGWFDVIGGREIVSKALFDMPLAFC